MRLVRPAVATRNLNRVPIRDAGRKIGKHGPQRAVTAAYYRGGTSRGLIFQPIDLPHDRAIWPAIFRQMMGSPDPYGRQLDGMGAGISSLSKICLVERMEKKLHTGSDGFEHGGGIDCIDYTFVGIGIENDEVDVAGNCGNMSSAIGPYAYNARLLAKSVYGRGDGNVKVRIRNTNTQKYIDSTFAVVDGQADVGGHYAIDGVAGTGSKIKLDFMEPYGSKTGKVLPTGRKIDTIAGYKVTCIDGANPCIFIRADDLNIDGTILPADLNKLSDKLALLEDIRKAAAVAMGIAATEDEVPRTIPKIGIVSMSSTHRILSGNTLKNSQVDLVVRFISDTQPHRAIPLTVALTTAVAAKIPGTIVEQLLAPDPVDESTLTIGHASGRVQVNATMDENRPLTPISASVLRTARRIFEGKMYWTNKPKAMYAEQSNTGLSNKPKFNRSAPSRRHSLGLAFVEELRGRDSSYLYDIRKIGTAEKDSFTPQPKSFSSGNLSSYRPLHPLNSQFEKPQMLTLEQASGPNYIPIGSYEEGLHNDEPVKAGPKNLQDFTPSAQEVSPTRDYEQGLRFENPDKVEQVKARWTIAPNGRITKVLQFGGPEQIPSVEGCEQDSRIDGAESIRHDLATAPHQVADKALPSGVSKKTLHFGETKQNVQLARSEKVMRFVSPRKVPRFLIDSNAVQIGNLETWRRATLRKQAKEREEADVNAGADAEVTDQALS